MADVYVDNITTPVATIDLYSSSNIYQALYYDTGTLSSGSHTVKIAVKGQKNPSSLDYWVDCDKIEIN